MTAVDELTGMDRGVWLVTTESSSYVLDLDVGTVTRHPGPRASTTINATTRRLRTLDRCRVRESGHWTMRGGGGYLSLVGEHSNPRSDPPREIVVHVGNVSLVIRTTLSIIDWAKPGQCGQEAGIQLDDAVDYFQSLGPWWDAQTAAVHLNVSVSDRETMIVRQRVLAVTFADEHPYLPSWQFHDGHAVVGLDEILSILFPAFTGAETVAAWFLSDADDSGALRQIDLLRAGGREQVLRDARSAAERILRR